MIRKTVMLGNIRIEIAIVDGMATITTSPPDAARRMFQLAQKGGRKNISYFERRNAFVEKFEGLNALQIAHLLSEDVKQAPEAIEQGKKIGQKMVDKKNKEKDGN